MGQTGLSVSRVCFGSMTFGSQVDRAEAQRIIDYCLDREIDFFDTANVYNQGESERILGECLKGKRDKVILASKAFGKMNGKMNEGYEGLSRAAILRAVEDSLRRLGTDYLDLYYLHHPDAGVPIEESLEALNQLRAAGKIRVPALSNYSAWQMLEAQWISAERQYAPPTVTQSFYKLLARGLEEEMLPMCRKYGIFTCIYNPLAGGLLTGKQRKDGPLPGSRFDNNPMYMERYWHPAFFEAVDRLSAASARFGRSLLSLALTWIYNHTPADCIIMGASSLTQMTQNMTALDEGPLPEELIQECDAVWAQLRGVTPKYNR